MEKAKEFQLYQQLPMASTKTSQRFDAKVRVCPAVID